MQNNQGAKKAKKKKDPLQRERNPKGKQKLHRQRN